MNEKRGKDDEMLLADAAKSYIVPQVAALERRERHFL